MEQIDDHPFILRVRLQMQRKIKQEYEMMVSGADGVGAVGHGVPVIWQVLSGR